MDLAAAFYAAVAEVADGKVAEIEVERTFVDDEGELSRTREYDTIGDRMSTVSATCQVLELECLHYTYEGVRGSLNPTYGDKWDGVCINCMVDFLKRMPDITPRYCRPVCINEG